MIRAQQTARPRQARGEWADTLGWGGEGGEKGVTGGGGSWTAMAVTDCILRLTCGCGPAAGPSLPGMFHQSHVGVGRVHITFSPLSAQAFVSICRNVTLKQV